MLAILRGHGHASRPVARGRKDGVADRGRQADEPGFAGAGGGQIFAVQQYDLDFRSVAEARNALLREVGFLKAAVQKKNLFKKRPADALHDGARELVPEAVWVDDGAAFPSLHDA